MRRDEFATKIREIVGEDPRYREEAYHFVADAVSFTAKRARQSERGKVRHIRGQELLEGISDSAKEKFGALALDVLAEWGITRTEDFGQIVFVMVRSGLLGASEEDKPEDFADGYDFREVFLKPYVPAPDEELPELPRII